MKTRRRSQTEQTLDISPLIDMVFILLIFFMVSTTFDRDHKVDISRPKASTAVVASSKSLKIFIDRSQNIFLNDEPIRLWVLQSRLREKFKNQKSKSVLVVTDKNVSSERLIEVIDQCRLGGAEDVGVATEVEAGA